MSVAGEGACHDRPRAVGLAGYPDGSRLFRLPVLEGRMPAAGAADEVLMTRTVREPYPGIALGSEVTLQFRERRAKVRVVGIVEEIGAPAFYAPFATYEAVTGLGDASAVLRVRANGEPLDLVASALDQALLDARLPLAQMITRAMFRDALDEHFKVVGDVLRMVALAAALVGAIILGAGTSLNVMERTREIGVLRALGATPRAIAAMLLGEGAAIALLGALIAVGLSIAPHAGHERHGGAHAAARGGADALLARRPRHPVQRGGGAGARGRGHALFLPAALGARQPHLRGLM